MSRAAMLLAVSLLLGAVPLVGADDSTSANYLVGYDPANETQARIAIGVAGGSIERTIPEIGVAFVSTDDSDAFHLFMDNSPWVDYVETNDETWFASAGSNGGQWNGAQWNGAQWNGGQWNGGQWNGGQWNGGQWNGGQWNSWSEPQRKATVWTLEHFEPAPGWSYDLATSDPGLVWQWGLWAMGAVPTTSGGSVELCVLDTGVAWDHPDLASAYVRGVNVIAPFQSAYDDAGHGTHIASIAAARADDAFGIAGVADVGILNAKVLDANGQGSEGDLAFGIVWCALQGAEVAVMALNASEEGPTMDRAIQFAVDRDVLLLASAGNSGTEVGYPARDPRVVAVSAVDGDLAIASFSGRGPEVEIAAPGVNVIGAFLDSSFAFGSGTSQAVAYAAGLAAHLRDDDPGLTAAAARARLAEEAHDLGAVGLDPLYGHGLLDATDIR